MDSSHRKETRKCPQCGELKFFPARHIYCSKLCADAAQREAADAAQKREIESLKHKLRVAREEKSENETYETFIGDIASRKISAPNWLAPRPGKKRFAIPTAFLSDTHFDEVVDPAQIGWVNAYDRDIAENRLRKFFESVIKVGKQYLTGLDFPGICIPLGGDIFSGNIHEELVETNVGSLQEAILYWLSPMISGIRLMADEFGKVYLPCVVGNHPRSTKKPRHKGRVRDNFDWLFYQLMARELSGDKRITFNISESPDVTYKIFGTRYCLTHGDQFKGGSGISGLLSPLMIGDARKRKRAVSISRPYDYMIMGHFHQIMQAKSVIVNGSLKGYDEYAMNNNFDYEPPQQAFWLTSQERKENWGFTPLHVTSADDPYSGSNASHRADKPSVSVF